jgi:hypothetical protein
VIVLRKVRRSSLHLLNEAVRVGAGIWRQARALRETHRWQLAWITDGEEILRAAVPAPTGEEERASWTDDRVLPA